jgi:hypothetical protein
MSAPDRYLLDVSIAQGVIDAEVAREHWARWDRDPDLRDGTLEDGFTLYARSQFGFRFAPAVYTPIPDVE